MEIPIHEICSQCPAEDPKIIDLFTRELYCGKYCYAEGVAEYKRMIARFFALEIEEVVPH